MIDEQTLEHGQRVGELRWCGVCHEYHHRHYMCDHYGNAIRDEVRNEIRSDKQAYSEQLRNAGISMKRIFNILNGNDCE